MPRPPRLQVPGGIYHITARGNRRQPTFLDSDDHRFHLWCLNKVVAECEWECDGFCHMPNHFHMLIRTPKPNLSSGMQRLNGLYAQVFNNRHGLSGHVFQGRFHSVLVEGEGHLLELARYMDLNPVRAGLCDHPLDWRWSSCRALMGLVAKPDFLNVTWLLGQFGRDLEYARQRYLAFLEDRLDRAA
jgi:putative transposase